MAERPLAENPFASPLAPPEHLRAREYPEIWIDGSDLVVRSGVVLPRRCVRTNFETPPDCEQRKTLSWATPWIYLLILVNLVILAIVYFVIRKQCVVTYSEAGHLTRRRRNRMGIVGGVVAASIVGIIYGISAQQGVIMVVSLLAFLFSLIGLLIVSQPPLRIAKHKDGQFWLRGCSPEFLNTLAAGGI